MNQPKNSLIRRGAIFYADFGSQSGSTIKGIRPAMIVQNNTGNQYAKTIIVAPVVPLQKQKRHPTHVTINSEFGLSEASLLLLEQIITVDKQSLGDYIGTATEDFMDIVDHALAISVGIPPLKNKKSSEWKANRKQLLAEQKRQKAIEKRQASQPKTATQ